MKVEITDDCLFLFKEVFNPILLENDSGDHISISQRDNKFEIRCHTKGIIVIVEKE